MILLEIPVQKLVEEKAHLLAAEGPESALYAKGALDIIGWLMAECPPPSLGGSAGFPIVLRDAGNVH